MRHSSRQHFPAEYLSDLTTALETIQAQAEASFQGTETMPFVWLKMGPEYPSFCDQAFTYRNRTFAYLIDRLDEGGASTLSDEAKERLLAIAAQNDLIPCRFPVKAGSKPGEDRPADAGWNLLHLETGSPVIPEEVSSDQPVERSRWECLRIALQVTLNWIQENRAGDLEASCGIPGADPQVWFREISGEQAWVLIRPVDAPEYDDAGFIREHDTLNPYDGFECRVKLVSPDGGPAVFRSQPVGVFTDGPVKVHHPGQAPVGEGELPLGSKPQCREEDKAEQEVSGKGCLLFLVAEMAALLTLAVSAVKILC